MPIEFDAEVDGYSLTHECYGIIRAWFNADITEDEKTRRVSSLDRFYGVENVNAYMQKVRNTMLKALDAEYA